MFFIRRVFRLIYDIHLIWKSGQFDRDYYLSENPDIVNSRMPPLIHFLLYGGFEGRNPNSGFNTKEYVRQHRDARFGILNPLVYHLAYGRFENRRCFSVPPTYDDWIWRQNRCLNFDQPPENSESVFFHLVVHLNKCSREDIDGLANSVFCQKHQNWRFTILYKSEVADDVIDLSYDDSRCLFLKIKEGGAENTLDFIDSNKLPELGFLVLLNESVLLDPHALIWAEKAILEERKTRLLYGDHDTISGSGSRMNPFFKPDWNVELLKNYPYWGNLLVVSSHLIRSIRMGDLLDSKCLWKLALRLSGASEEESIKHISKVLYHERSGSLSQRNEFSKEFGSHETREKCIRFFDKSDSSLPKVSIIIPTYSNVGLLNRLFGSMEETIDFPSFEIIVINNGPEIVEESLIKPDCVGFTGTRLLNDERPFNFSSMINSASRLACGDVFLMLNDDVICQGAGWLSELVDLATRPENGAVGSLLLYPDRTVQHAGIVLFDSRACHIGRNSTIAEFAQKNWPLTRRNYLAVTGACLAVRKELFEKAGGLDEVFSVTWNDVDFCLKLHALGFRNVFTPYSVLVHDEGKTRWSGLSKLEGTDHGETRLMLDRWSSYFERDPFFSDHLSEEDMIFRLD